MEKYQMNRPYSRPYQTTCGMQRSQMSDCMSVRTMPQNRSDSSSCRSTMPERTGSATEMFSHTDHLALAMAYVPCQKFENTYDLCYALKAGSIFPELCKPFCGKRGVRRC